MPSDNQIIKPIAGHIGKRRTFAIISHPDAGKTTLTENILLQSGAINMAGRVRAKAKAFVERSEQRVRNHDALCDPIGSGRDRHDQGSNQVRVRPQPIDQDEDCPTRPPNGG